MPLKTLAQEPPLSSQVDAKGCLEQLSAGLDEAIQQAVDNPLLFADHPLIQAISRQCVNLLTLPLARSAELERLVWQIRSRAGKLQQLLDSASHFYAQCFAATPGDSTGVSLRPCLEYGVQGEWGVVDRPQHLSVNC